MHARGEALGSWEEWLDDERKVEVKKFYEQSAEDGDLPARVRGTVTFPHADTHHIQWHAHWLRHMDVHP